MIKVTTKNGGINTQMYGTGEGLLAEYLAATAKLYKMSLNAGVPAEVAEKVIRETNAAGIEMAKEDADD